MTNYPVSADIRIYLDRGEGLKPITGTVELGQIAEDGSLNLQGLAEILNQISKATANWASEMNAGNVPGLTSLTVPTINTNIEEND